MKYVKMLGLAAVAAMALMAVVGAGTASATTVCKTNVSPCPAGWAVPTGTTVHATLKAGTSAILEDTFGLVKNTCTESTVHGETTNETGTTVNMHIGILTFGSGSTPCTMTTDVLEATGNLSVNSSGTVSGTGFRVTVILGGETCIYGLGTGTTVGTFAGGNPATITANAVLNKQTGSGANCLNDTRWTATYVITSPTGTLHVTA